MLMRRYLAMARASSSATTSAGRQRHDENVDARFDDIYGLRGVFDFATMKARDFCFRANMQFLYAYIQTFYRASPAMMPRGAGMNGHFRAEGLLICLMRLLMMFIATRAQPFNISDARYRAYSRHDLRLYQAGRIRPLFRYLMECVTSIIHT